MKMWIKKILKITGILFLVLFVIAMGFLLYHRHEIFFFYCVMTEQIDKAADYLTEVIERDPDNPEVRELRFLIFFPKVGVEKTSQQVCEMLIEDCDKILEHQPDDKYYIDARNEAKAMIHSHLSMDHYKKGDHDKAAEEYMTAYKFWPNRLPLVRREAPEYGYYDVYKKKFDKPIAFYTVYIEKFPEVGLAYYFRGKVYAKKGDHEKALADFDSAIELIGDNRDYQYSNIYRSKAELCEKLGRKDEAIEAYKGFVEGDFSSVPDASVEDATQRIKVLEKSK